MPHSVSGSRWLNAPTSGDVMRVIVKGSELKAAAYAGTYVVVLAWDTSDGKMPSRNGFAGLCDRARRTRPGGQRGRTLLDARDQALQGKRQGTTARHPGLHCRASDPELPVGRLHRQGRHPLPVPDRPIVRHGKESETRRRSGGDARRDHRDRGRCSRPTAMASGTTSSSIVA